jgi:cholest-4-en-3-one 26-monooxygenase
VLLSIAAANHDRTVFSEPERLDLGRSPNPHLGFGWGSHFCLGSSLARLEARIAMSTLFERFADIQPVAPVGELRGSAMGFHHRRLPVTLA